MVKYRTGNRVPKTSTACAFCVRSANVLSVSDTVHIRFVRYTAVTRTSVDCSLYVTCVVRMRSLRLPGRPSPHRDDFHHWINIFCLFSVRSVSVTFIQICDSTIKITSFFFKIYLYFCYYKRRGLVISYGQSIDISIYKTSAIQKFELSHLQEFLLLNFVIFRRFCC